MTNPPLSPRHITEICFTTIHDECEKVNNLPEHKITPEIESRKFWLETTEEFKKLHDMQKVYQYLQFAQLEPKLNEIRKNKFFYRWVRAVPKKRWFNFRRLLVHKDYCQYYNQECDQLKYTRMKLTAQKYKADFEEKGADLNFLTKISVPSTEKIQIMTMKPEIPIKEIPQSPNSPKSPDALTPKKKSPRKGRRKSPRKSPKEREVIIQEEIEYEDVQEERKFKLSLYLLVFFLFLVIGTATFLFISPSDAVQSLKENLFSNFRSTASSNNDKAEVNNKEDDKSVSFDNNLENASHQIINESDSQIGNDEQSQDEENETKSGEIPLEMIQNENDEKLQNEENVTKSGENPLEMIQKLIQAWIQKIKIHLFGNKNEGINEEESTNQIELDELENQPEENINEHQELNNDQQEEDKPQEKGEESEEKNDELNDESQPKDDNSKENENEKDQINEEKEEDQEENLKGNVFQGWFRKIKDIGFGKKELSNEPSQNTENTKSSESNEETPSSNEESEETHVEQSSSDDETGNSEESNDSEEIIDEKDNEPVQQQDEENINQEKQEEKEEEKEEEKKELKEEEPKVNVFQGWFRKIKDIGSGKKELSNESSQNTENTKSSESNEEYEISEESHVEKSSSNDEAHEEFSEEKTDNMKEAGSENISIQQ